MNQTTPSVTSKQKRDARKLLTDSLDEAGLSKDEAQRVLGNGGKLKAGVKELLAKLSASDLLLEAVGTVPIPAVKTFMARDFFKIGEHNGVKIGYISDNFQNAFLAGDGKIETDIPEATLRVRKLAMSSVDGPIIAELGKENAETFLCQLAEMMKAQGQDQQGKLLTNGYANIFYIRATDGVLWAVRCSWYSGSGYWYVCASPVADPSTWYADGQVVSR